MNKAGIDLTKINNNDMEELKQNDIYQSISSNYNVNEVIKQWFGNFEELEKADVWH